MVCTECGARISEEDQFCPKCGAKVIKKRRCPDCGALLRQDNKFCPKCGRLVGEKKTAKAVSQDTMDIPMESIERNILSETAAEIRTDRREERVPHKSTPKKPSSSQGTSSRKPSSEGRTERSGSAKSRSEHEEPVRRKKAEPPVQKKKSQPAPPPKKRRPVYREEIVEDDDWEDEDWDEDDDDEEGTDILTIMTAVMGCVVLIIVAFVAFRLYQQYVPKNYDKVAKEQAKEQEEAEEDSKGDQEEGQPEQDAEQSEDEEPEGAVLGTLTISKNVNVRDNPSTSGSNVIKVAQAGESYEYLEVIDDGEWYKIALSEDGYTEGYVYAEYVTVD